MRVLEDGMKYSIMTVSRTGEADQWSCCCCFITCNCLNPDTRPDGGRQGAFKHKFLVMLLSVSQIILNTVRTAEPLSTKTRVEVAGLATAVYWEVSNRLQCAWQFLNTVTSVYRWEADSRHRSASLVFIL